MYFKYYLASSQRRRGNKTAHTTATHFQYVISRLFSWSACVLEQWPRYFVVPYYCFCNSTQVVCLIQASVTEVYCPLPLGKFTTLAEMCFSISAFSELSYCSVRPPRSLACYYWRRLEIGDVILTKLGTNSLYKLQGRRNHLSSVTVVGTHPLRMAFAGWFATLSFRVLVTRSR